MSKEYNLPPQEHSIANLVRSIVPGAVLNLSLQSNGLEKRLDCIAQKLGREGNKFSEGTHVRLIRDGFLDASTYVVPVMIHTIGNAPEYTALAGMSALISLVTRYRFYVLKKAINESLDEKAQSLEKMIKSR